MEVKIPIKTIQYQNIPVKTRYLFLKHLQRNVHEFALNRQDQFLATGNTAEHFHKDKQNKSKTPVFIHSLNLNGFFTLRAYTQPAIQTLNQYQQLLQKVKPLWTENCIESIENCQIKETEKPQVYESQNWLPYRDCVVKNGIFYDREKNKIADFENRIKGNVGSFLRTILGENPSHAEAAKQAVKILQITAQNRTNIALLTQGKEIKKHPFNIQIRINYQLPRFFSLGQNVAFGNGVFKRIQ
ncbi:MAG: hypothetical protein MI810_02090 [Flavobacteriales bacterium]|nr:hypothetical protein [Flavobacteriales bacterium]